MTINLILELFFLLHNLLYQYESYWEFYFHIKIIFSHRNNVLVNFTFSLYSNFINYIDCIRFIKKYK